MSMASCWATGSGLGFVRRGMVARAGDSLDVVECRFHVVVDNCDIVVCLEELAEFGQRGLQAKP